MTFSDLNSLMKVDVENYERLIHYDLSLRYNKQGYFDIKVVLLSPFKNTKLKVVLLEPSKVVGHNGKKLENAEALTFFAGESKIFGNLLSQKTANNTKNIARIIGAITVAISFSLFSISGHFGFFLGAMAKFF